MASNVIPSDTQASLFDPIKALSELDRRAIIRPNNPPDGIAGFIFDIVADESVELTAESTDNFVENNTAIQDQIALAPERISLKGLVAELRSVAPSAQSIAKAGDALPDNPNLLPPLTPGVIQAKSLELTSTEDAQSLYSYFKGSSQVAPNQTRQAEAFEYFYELWKGRQLFSVQSAWGIWNDMHIVSMSAVQSEDTRFVSSFSITFKKFRFAQDITINAGQLAGRAASQQSGVKQNGNLGKTIADQGTTLFQMVSGL